MARLRFLSSLPLFVFAFACGSSEQPEIKTFSADRMFVAPGETVTLTYSVYRAKQISITAQPEGTTGTTVISEVKIPDGTNEASGTVTTPPLDVTTALQLIAINGDYTASSTITISVTGGGDEVRILRFAAMPASIQPGERTTLMWDTANATGGRIELRGSGDVIDPMITLPSGSITVDPFASATFTLYAEGKGGPVLVDAIVTVGPRPMEDAGTPDVVNDNDAMVAGDGGDLDGGDGGMIPNLSGMYTAPGVAAVFSGALGIGEVDVYRIDVVAPAILRATSYVPNVAGGGCTNADMTVADTLLTLYASDGVTELGSDDDDGPPPRCSHFDENDPFANLAPGTYYLAIEDLGRDDVIPAYELSVEGVASMNNDGGMGNDGGMLTFLATFTAPGPTLDYTGAIIPANDIDRFQIVITQASYLRAETFAPGIGTCGDDTVPDNYMTLFEADGVTEIASDDDTGVGRCALLDENNGPLLQPGIYYLEIEELGNDEEIAAYVVRFDSVLGPPGMDAGVGDNGGNMLPVNGTYASPGAPVVFNGSLSIAAEIDRYQVNVAQTSYLRMETWAPTIASGMCQNADTTEVDTVVTLYASDGVTELGNDDDGGFDRCSFWDETYGFARLLPGTYYLEVNEFGDDTAIPAYDIRLYGILADICGNGVLEMPEICDDGNGIDGDLCSNTCQTNIPDPNCGNGFLNLGEPCDDSNNVSGDGCSAFCQEEGIIFTAPAMVSQIISHAIATVQDFDVYTINVTGAAYVRGEIFAPFNAGGGCLNADTVVELYASDGVTLLASDTGGGIDGCSRLDTADTLLALAAGTYFLTVYELGDDAIIPQYQLVFDSVAANLCGNGVVETGEQCEDGNATAGDGCSTTCQFENAVIAETEPNNARANADPTNLNGAGGAVASGAITPAGDGDYFRIDVPVGTTRTLVARTFTGPMLTPNVCTNATTDTLLSLEDSAGTQLAANNDRSATVACSEIDGRSTAFPGAANLTSGTYYLRVRGNLAQTPTYYLSIILR